MSATLTPQQTLVLWNLLGRGGEAWKKHLRPKLKPGDQKTLKAAKIIAVERRRDERTRRRGDWIEVTDKGWAWANDHLASPLPTKTQSAGPILQLWLFHLQGFLRREGRALADVIATPTKPMSPHGPVVSPTALENRIKSAYLDASAGSWNKRVRLSELRTLLGVVQRADLDNALMRMQQGGTLVLYPLDNPQEITAADRDAAVAIGGTRFHIVYLRG